MKNLLNSLLIIVLCMISISTNAQDIITKKDGTDISAKVLEVTTSVIKYKKFENQDGPIYNIKKSDVLMIRYENGTNDIFYNESIHKTNSKPVDDNSCSVIIYRERSFFGSLISYKLFVNDKNIVKIKNGCLYKINFPVGSYEFAAKTESRTVETKKIEAGNTYYLKCGIKLGVFIGRPKLKFVDYSTASTETMNLSRIDLDALKVLHNDNIKPFDENLILQHNAYNKKLKNSTYIEAFGISGFSANYERLLFNFKKSSIAFRVGAGIRTYIGPYYSNSPIIPIMLNYLYGYKNNHLEAGFGVFVHYYPIPTFTLGYRYQKPTKGFLFKADINKMLTDDFPTKFTLCIGIGYAF